MNKLSRHYRLPNQSPAFEIPALPFLSIMLGLMSIMALTTIGISVQQRQKAQKNTLVELVGVPSNFIPFHIRCQADSIAWLDDNLKWNKTSVATLFRLLTEANEKTSLTTRYGDSLVDFLLNKVNENKSLSFSSQQNSLILWVEPDGVDTSTIFKQLLFASGIPLRIGLLPVMQGEEIYHGALETQ